MQSIQKGQLRSFETSTQICSKLRKFAIKQIYVKFSFLRRPQKVNFKNIRQIAQIFVGFSEKLKFTYVQQINTRPQGFSYLPTARREGAGHQDDQWGLKWLSCQTSTNRGMKGIISVPTQWLSIMYDRGSTFYLNLNLEVRISTPY